MYTVYKLKCPSPLALALRLHQDFLKVHLWIIKAAVSRAQRRSYSVSHLHRVRRFHADLSCFLPKSFNENRLAETSLAFQSFDHPILRISGCRGLILNAKHRKVRNLPRTLSRGDTQWDPPVSTETNGDWKLPALSAEDGFTPKFFRTCCPCYVIIQVLQWLRLGIQTNWRMWSSGQERGIQYCFKEDPSKTSTKSKACIATKNISTCDYMSSISTLVEVKKNCPLL